MTPDERDIAIDALNDWIANQEDDIREDDEANRPAREKTLAIAIELRERLQTFQKLMPNENAAI